MMILECEWLRQIFCRHSDTARKRLIRPRHSSTPLPRQATCLVVDIQLGDISGVELARQLAADSFKYPIIFMTALDDERIRSQAEAVGAVAYLGKPFLPNLLIEAIAKAIG
jgi:FixJ family two-component response regulator